MNKTMMNKTSDKTINRSIVWKKLQACVERTRDFHLRELFAGDPERVGKFSCVHECERGGLFLDYSKNRITDEAFSLLLELAHEADVTTWRERLFRGEPLNESEGRAALHPVLRDDGAGPAAAAGRSDEAAVNRARMYAICENLRAGRRRGASGKPLRDLVCIGIGGSHLGPALACRALAHLAHENLRVFFIADADARRTSEVLDEADPERTLVVVTSKSFKTRETLVNAEIARDWVQRHRAGDAWRSHFMAITANPDAARQFGVAADDVLEIWDGIGGRFSLWSSVGFPLATLIGPERFDELLAGARSMDAHFAEVPSETNLPVILALLDVWYVNFHGAATRAVLPYDYALGLLPEYLQQLEMESNGKSVDREGRALPYATAPVVWGKSGIEGQHAFFQLLHQGGRLVPTDFIIVGNKPHPASPNDDVLRDNFLAQTRALAFGDDGGGDPRRANPGNQPSNALVLDALSPFTLGLLLALYEHKVFVEAAIWGVNPLDQWGVELGKRIAAGLSGDADLDASTRGLMKRIR